MAMYFCSICGTGVTSGTAHRCLSKSKFTNAALINKTEEGPELKEYNGKTIKHKINKRIGEK